MNKYKLLCIALCLPFLWSCKSEEAKTEVIRPVKVSTAEAFNYKVNIYSGIVAPNLFSNLAFRGSGQIISLSVENGQNVKKGDEIARIDAASYKLDYDAKQALYITAQQQLARAERLLEQEAISKQEFESTRANTESAKAAFVNAKILLGETVLKAPFDGFIQQKFVENYQEVRAGESIVNLINPQQLKIQATLPDNALRYISNNPELYVRFDAYNDVKFSAKLKEYVQASPDGSGIPVFVTIDDEKFNLNDYNVAVGFSCLLEIVVRNENANDYVVVPFSAVVNKPESNKAQVFVYDAKNEQVIARNVTMGEIIEQDKVIISSGLKAGEIVVSAGANRVANNQKVKLLK